MADFLARLHAVDPDHINVPGLTEIEDPEQVLSTCLPNDKIGDAVQRTLNAGVHRRPNANVLLHGDFWPGNVMFNHQDLVAVLDWEDATWGDPLADLACARVELTCAYGPEASARFTARYVSSLRRLGRQLVQDDLPLWDLYVSATALSAMHLWGLSPHDESARRANTRLFLEAAARRLIEQN